MRDADALLLVTAPEGLAGSPGGKLYEYLAACRPILAVPGTDEFVADVLQRTGHGVCAPDAEAVQAALERLASGSLIAPSWPSADLEEFTWAARSRQLVDVFESCLARRTEAWVELMCGIVGVWNLDGRARGCRSARGRDEDASPSRSGRRGVRARRLSDRQHRRLQGERDDASCRPPTHRGRGEWAVRSRLRSPAPRDPRSERRGPPAARGRETGDAFVFNGEIYNHRELRGRLTSAGRCSRADATRRCCSRACAGGASRGPCRAWTGCSRSRTGMRVLGSSPARAIGSVRSRSSITIVPARRSSSPPR